VSDHIEKHFHGDERLYAYFLLAKCPGCGQLKMLWHLRSRRGVIMCLTCWEGQT